MPCEHRRRRLADVSIGIARDAVRRHGTLPSGPTRRTASAHRLDNRDRHAIDNGLLDCDSLALSCRRATCPTIKVVSLCARHWAVHCRALRHRAAEFPGPAAWTDICPFGQGTRSPLPIPAGGVARNRNLVSGPLARTANPSSGGRRMRLVDRPDSLRPLALNGSESVAHKLAQPPKLPASNRTPVQKQNLAQQRESLLARARRLRGQARAPPRRRRCNRRHTPHGTWE